MSDKLKTGLIVFFLALLIVFNQPVMGIFSGRFWGLPGTILYFGFIWCLVILGLIWLSGKMNDEKES